MFYMDFFFSFGKEKQEPSHTRRGATGIQELYPNQHPQINKDNYRVIAISASKLMIFPSLAYIWILQVSLCLECCFMLYYEFASCLPPHYQFINRLQG